MYKKNRPEILAPAGSMESVYAAARCGADGIYVGGKRFSARANAVNFSFEELKNAAQYCHIRGIKLYRAMNVIIFDSEAEEFYNEVRLSAEAGVDGIIVQDLGGLLIARQAVPDMPLHGSTQMTIHTPLAAKAAKKLGICRIVPARELSLGKIEGICKTGIETEVFVHGAQCMCLSGQCYMSALIGSRSANRGQCAQACRLPFTASGNNGEYALSLKDMSLVRHIRELRDIGCASFKIEGRMKRPEYVAAAVTAVRNALDGSEDTENDIDRLEAVFSRSGFTDGYLMNKRGRDMFGYRRKEDVLSADSVLSELSSLYAKEKGNIPVSFEFEAKENSKSVLKFSCKDVSGQVMGKIPEKAVNRSLSDDDACRQLSKLGDTPYFADNIRCNTDDGLMLPMSEINRMRRTAAAELDKMLLERNTPVYHVSDKPFDKINFRSGHSEKALFRAAVSDISVMKRLRGADMFILPMHLCGELTDAELISRTIVSPPALVTDEERLLERLRLLRQKGFTHFMCENLTHLGVLSMLPGITVHGGTGMNIANSYSAEQCGRLGFFDIMLSFEMKSGQIKSLKSPVPAGIFAYGRLPLMTVRNCPVKAFSGCGGRCEITDRTGRKFLLSCREKEYAVIYNSDILETSDKRELLSAADFAVLDLSGLSCGMAQEVIDRYACGGKPCGTFTRGLYFRGVF